MQTAMWLKGKLALREPAGQLGKHWAMTWLCLNLHFCPSVAGRRDQTASARTRPESDCHGSSRCLLCSLKRSVFASSSSPAMLRPPRSLQGRLFIKSHRSGSSELVTLTFFKKHDGAFLISIFVFMTFSLLTCLYMHFWERGGWDSHQWREGYNRSRQKSCLGSGIRNRIFAQICSVTNHTLLRNRIHVFFCLFQENTKSLAPLTIGF